MPERQRRIQRPRRALRRGRGPVAEREIFVEVNDCLIKACGIGCEWWALYQVRHTNTGWASRRITGHRKEQRRDR